jgi:predicted dehydrogenase
MTMPQQTIRVGVIGLGVGERHITGYQEMPGVEVRAICDLDPAKLAEVGDRRQIGRRYDNYRKITEDPEIDVVSICSYDNFHTEQAISAFSNGKHVMVEKPVALSRKDAEAVLRAMQDNGRLITSNLILRQSPRFRALRDSIIAGEFGKLFYMEGDYIHQILWKILEGWRGKMDFYCVTYGGGIHLIDLMRWLVGEEVTEVCGMGNKILTAGSDYKYDDTIVNLLRFESGLMAKTLTTFGSQRTQLHALNVYGDRKTFINDMPDAKIFDGDMPENESRDTTPYPAIQKSDLLPDFIAAIREGREPIVGAKDVFRVMDICFAAWESVTQRRTVTIDYLI